MKHLPQCRTHLKQMFQNYGSDCTCGAEHLLALVKQKWDEGPKAVTEHLNDHIQWTGSHDSLDTTV